MDRRADIVMEALQTAVSIWREKAADDTNESMSLESVFALVSTPFADCPEWYTSVLGTCATYLSGDKSGRGTVTDEDVHKVFAAFVEIIEG
jgi:hypothetical protein